MHRVEPRTAVAPATGRPAFDIVLEPLSRPGLGAIRIDGELFAIGRAEPPFDGYGDDIVAMLSRRHARLFCEGDAVYLADLDSRNGTTVNRERVAQSPCRLRDGDEIGFGGVLSYRVRIGSGASARQGAPVPALQLTPAAADSDLQSIVVTRLPFLVSKNDPAFMSQGQDAARQSTFLSRRHAHIFQKDGRAWVEDLASTNGTFVDGLRLQEHAVPLEDGMLLAFGGDHFTYRVSLGENATSGIARPPATPSIEPRPVATADRTTFVVAPTSFLDIFCLDDEPAHGGAAESPALPALAAAQKPAQRRPRSRSALLWSEILSLWSGGEGSGTGRAWWKAAALAGLVAAGGIALYWHGADERALQAAIAAGEHARAAALADRALGQRPDDAALQAQATEAALKAHVPAWLARLAANDFEGAKAVLADLAPFAQRNPDLQPLLGELQWLGDLERLVGERGGPAAPIRLYADEDRIAALIARWNDGTGEHQRALARIASHVPQFSAPYAQSLTHLRRLQSEATVHLAAIDRLKASIAAELARDNPQALDSVLKEAADRYPTLGGLDGVRQDLTLYLEIQGEARSRRSAHLFVLLQRARFTTPPFQGAYRELAAGGRLPAEPLVQQYAAATRAWQQGRPAEAFADLQAMAAGPWAAAIASELSRRRAVVAQHETLQASRATAGHVERLLAFRAALDAEQDVYFARATQAEFAQHKDEVLAHARDAMQRSQALWQEYRNGGPIDAQQRAEAAISAAFRARARLLAEAHRLVQQATRIHALTDATPPAPWRIIHDEIGSEAEQQRGALLALRNVLEPELLQRKLALLGEGVLP